MVEKEKKSFKSALRERLRLLILLGMLCISAGYFAANINKWVNTPMIKNTLLDLAMNRFWGNINAGMVEIELGESTIKGRNVEVRDRWKRLIAEAPYAEIKFDLPALFWWRLKLARIEMRRPYVHMWTDPDGVYLWKKFKKPPKKVKRFHTRAGKVTVTDAEFEYDYYPQPRPVHVHLKGIDGSADFTEKTAFTKAAIDSLHLEFPGFDHYFRDITTEGIIDEAFVEVKRLRARFLDIPIGISGRLDGLKTKNPRMRFKVGAAGKIGDLLRYFDYEKNPPGVFSLEARVTGRTDKYEVAGHFSSEWGIVEEQRYDNLEADFDYHRSDDTVRLKNFSIDMYGAHVTGKGGYVIGTGEFFAAGVIKLPNRTLSYRTEGVVDTDTGEITFRTLDFRTPYADIVSSGRWGTRTGELEFDWKLKVSMMEQELPHWGFEYIGGALELRGDIRGKPDDLGAEAAGEVCGLTYLRAHLGDGPVRARLDGGTMYLTVASAGGDTDFDFDSGIRLFRGGELLPSPKMEVFMDIGMSGVELTQEVFDTDFTGILSGQLALSGTPSRLSGGGRMKLVKGKAWGQDIESIRAEVAYDHEGISFHDATVVFPGGDTGRGGFSMKWNLDYDLQLVANGLHLQSLNMVTESGHPVNGVINAKLGGHANFNRPVVSGEVEFLELGYEKLDLESADMSFVLKGDVVTINASQPWGIRADGSYNVVTGDFMDFKIQLDNVDILPFCQWKCLADTEGRVTGRLALNGGAEGWEYVDYHLFLTDLRLEYREEKIRNTLPVRVEIGPHGGKQDIHLLAADSSFDLAGTLSETGAWDLDVSADLDLALLSDFIPQIRSSGGRLVADGRAVGPGVDMNFYGSINLSDGSLKLREYHADFKDVFMQVVSEESEVIEIKSLRGRIGEKGSFDISGDLYHRGTELTGMELALNAQEIPFQSRGTYKIVVSPELKLTGTPREPTLSGQITVVDGRYKKEVRIERQFIEVKRETAPTRQVPGWAKNLKMNVRVVDEGNFEIDNNLAQIHLKTDLLITGTLSDPVLDGEIEGVGGSIIYGGTRFELVRGRIDFSNPVEIDPLVDVLARTTIREYEVRLYLQGALSHMELRLESTPALDDQNILSLITFRKTLEELSRNEYQALATLPLFFSKGVGRAVGKPLDDYTGLDIFTVEAREESPGAKVIVGKKLSKRMELRYSSEMGGADPVQETRLTYKITDNLWLQGSQDSDGIYGFRLNFHFTIR